MSFDVEVLPSGHSEDGDNLITVLVTHDPPNNDFKKDSWQEVNPEGNVRIVELIVDDDLGGNGDNPIVFDLRTKYELDPGAQQTKFVVYHKDDIPRNQGNRRGESQIVIANDDPGSGGQIK